MKIQYTLLTLVCLSLSTVASAHCPTAFKEERVCLMLDKDKLFIYDQKFEHNGPYKDLEKAQIVAFKTATGTELAFKKVARGIFKIEGGEKEKTITVIFDVDKKKSELKVSQQH